jgi:hypothetical protein
MNDKNKDEQFMKMAIEQAGIAQENGDVRIGRAKGLSIFDKAVFLPTNFDNFTQKCCFLRIL